MNFGGDRVEAVAVCEKESPPEMAPWEVPEFLMVALGSSFGGFLSKIWTLSTLKRTVLIFQKKLPSVEFSNFANYISDPLACAHGLDYVGELHIRDGWVTQHKLHLDPTILRHMLRAILNNERK